LGVPILPKKTSYKLKGAGCFSLQDREEESEDSSAAGGSVEEDSDMGTDSDKGDVMGDDGVGDDDDKCDSEDGSEGSDSDSLPTSKPGSTRHVSHDVVHVEGDKEVWPVTDSQQAALQKFWGKFVVPKHQHEQDPCADKVEKAEKVEDAVDDPTQDSSGDSDSDSSSAPMPSSSRELPNEPWVDRSWSPSWEKWDKELWYENKKYEGREGEEGIPLCVDWKLNDVCPGDGCDLCRILNESASDSLKKTKGLKRRSHAMFGSDDDESDHEHPVVPDYVDGTHEFEKAMLGTSSAAQMRALKSETMEEPVTMKTPDCPQPGFFGFPIVPTPERMDKHVPEFQNKICVPVVLHCRK